MLGREGWQSKDIMMRSGVNAEEHSSIAKYDPNGNRIYFRDPNSVGADSTYDALNRETATTDTAGDTVSREYDGNGNLTTLTDARGKSTAYAYDSRDRRTSTTDRLGGVTAFQYDASGNMTRLSDAQASQTDYVFDARNLTVAEIFPPGEYEDEDVNEDGYPDARTRTYICDAAGRLVRRLDQTLAVTTYSYDMASRLLARAYKHFWGYLQRPNRMLA